MYYEFCYGYELCSQIRARTLVILGPGSEKKWYGTYDLKPNGSWDNCREMLLNFAETNHPVFRGTSALERGDVRSTSMARHRENIEFASPNGHLCQSAQYLRSSSGYD